MPCRNVRRVESDMPTKLNGIHIAVSSIIMIMIMGILSYVQGGELDPLGRKVFL